MRQLHKLLFNHHRTQLKQQAYIGRSEDKLFYHSFYPSVDVTKLKHECLSLSRGIKR